jgi:hypothetical protein
MTTKYEIIEGDHWKFVSSHDTPEEADIECARLNREHNRDYFVQRNVDGKISYRNPVARAVSERRAVRELDIREKS